MSTFGEGGGPVAIETESVTQVLGYLSEYLADESTLTSRRGRVITVSGDYGTGKTHLAMTLCEAARRDPRTDVLYIGAAPDNFVVLYQSFLKNLEQDRVLACMRGYYADVVADSLEASDLTRDMGEQVRTGQADVEEVISLLSLNEADFQTEVRARLQGITRNHNFGTALTLMLRPGFEDVVWDWLGGEAPNEVLVDREIAGAIDSEETALEAMGVLGLILGHRDSRLVLVVDELEQILCRPTRPDDRAVSAFRSMLTVLTEAGVFLVLAGLPDFLGELPRDVHDRFSASIEMSALSAGDAEEYIRESQQRISGVRTLEPFTPEIVDYLAELAEYTPRNIIRLCYHVYRRVMSEQVPITREIVREAAQTHISILSTRVVRDRIGKILEQQGRAHLRDHLIGDAESGSPVDFWVFAGSDRSRGVAVIVADSVLNTEDADALLQRIQAISAGPAPQPPTGADPPNPDPEPNPDPDPEQEPEPEQATVAHLLLVMNGFVAGSQHERLVQAVGQPPLGYSKQPAFAQRLSAELDQMLGRMSTSSAAHAPAEHTDLMQRLERLGLQQEHSSTALGELTAEVRAIRAENDRMLNRIAREISAGSREARAMPAPQPPPEPGPESQLPPAVVELLTEARTSLAVLEEISTELREYLSAGAPAPGPADVLGNTRTTEIVHGLGVAVFLQCALDVLEVGLGEWALRHPEGAVGAGSVALARLTGAFDSVLEYLPMPELERAARILGVDERGQAMPPLYAVELLGGELTTALKGNRP